MRPLSFLAAMMALTAAAWAVNALLRARRAAVLGRLAGVWQLRYASRDPFNLAIKIGERFPVPGAADLRVVDLLYGSEPGRHRYLATVQFTQGVVHGKRRLWRVATFSESHDAGHGEGVSPLQLAPVDLPWKEQYVFLRDMLANVKPEDERSESPDSL
jgi:hypothetical protein